MNNSRLQNFEFLRIYAMFFIVFGHLQGYMHCSFINSSGVLAKSLSSFFNALGICSVDLFVLITGYFLINSTKNSIYRSVKIYVETLFYLVTITLIFFVCGKASVIDIAKSFFPLAPTSFNYWFITVYIALILLQPFLSKLAGTLSKRQYQLLLLTLLLINTELVTGFPLGEILSGSFKLLWFINLFFIGGYIRLYQVNIRHSWLCYFIFIVMYMLASLLGNGIFHLGYNSLITLGIAVSLFFLAKSWEISNNKVIDFLAPSVLSVYIIHQHFLMGGFLSKILLTYAPTGVEIHALYVIGATLLIFIFCVVIDKIRLILFKKSGFDNWLNRSTKVAVDFVLKKFQEH